MQGISCSNDEVTHIDLVDMGLSIISIPAELSTFPGLTSLLLAGNSLMDPTVPASLIAVANLTELSLETDSDVALQTELVQLPL